VRDGLNRGQFQNGPLLEKLDVVFASRYLDALAAYQAGGTATRSWMLAFHGCDDASLLILQQLLTGMNAHINLDLGIAAAQVSPGVQLPQIKTDFDQINALLAGLVGSVEAEIASLSPLIGDLEKLGLRTETSVVNFSMQAARDHAWIVAQHLAREPANLHDATVGALDVAVYVGGEAILHPLVSGVGLQLIQQAEVKDVRRVIEVLSQPATSAAQAASAT